jgi:hypothetical protein
LARPNRNVKFWAVTASIAVHLILLTTFAVIKLSPSHASASQNHIPIAAVTQIKKLIDPEKIIPKPKIKSSSKNKIAKKSRQVLHPDTITDSLDITLNSSLPAIQTPDDLTRPPVSTSDLSPPAATQPIHNVEFFGSKTDSRKTCFLVDCSGSMRGLFKRVQTNLKNSIQALQPDQYFTIIFFGSGKLFEFADGKLLRASEKNKISACKFIASVIPAGQTNALIALQRAMRIRDNNGKSPSTIYFLTDGFELTGENRFLLSDKINDLLNLSKTIKINTIGFWPAEDDAKLLKIIATTTGGDFVNITD